MKKLSKYILFIITALFITIMPASAKDVDLATLGNLVLKEESSSRAFYVIGKYVFTDVYVKNNSLNIEDIMLAARSIKLLETDGETKTSEAYKKMNIYTVSLYQDGWKFNNNLIGSTKLEDDSILDIEYIDYEVIPNTYTITFVDQVTDTSRQSKTYTYPDVTPSDLASVVPEEKAHYTFVGWFQCLDEECETLASEVFNFNAPISEDIKLKAKWEENKYTVTFKGLDGGDQVYEVKQSDPYIKVEDLPDTTKIGHVFDGWYMCTNDECTTTYTLKFNFETNEIQKDCTFLAKWTIATYNVVFKTDEKEIYETKYVDHDNKVEAASEPHKHDADKYNGFKFKGWYACNNENCDEIESTPFDFNNTNITKNTILIAQYDEVVYTNKIMADFTENLKSRDFSVLVKDNSNIEFTILNHETDLNTNFANFVRELENILAVDNVSKIQIDYSGKTIYLTSESNISDEFKKVFASLTNKSFENSKIYDLDGTGFKMTIILEDGTKNNVDDDTTDSYNVSFSTLYALVHDEGELRSALLGDRMIVIYNNITVNSVLEINKDITIDGRNHTITSNITNNKYLFKINSGSVSMKDLILKIDTLKPSEYDKANGVSRNSNKNTIGIYVATNAKLTVTNIKVTSDKLINRDNLILDGEELHMSNVAINENAAVELHGELSGSGLSYDNELYGSPTILMESNSTAKMNLGSIHRQSNIYNVTRGESDSYKKREEFVHYYHNDNNTKLIYSWYHPYNGYLTSVSYLYGEHFIVPDIFSTPTPNKYNSYSKNGKTYKFNNHWYFSDGTTREYLSSEELKTRRAVKDVTYQVSAQYDEQ